MYDEDYHYEAFVTRRGGSRAVVLRRKIHDLEAEGPIESIPSAGRVRLAMRADRVSYEFAWECLGEGQAVSAGRAGEPPRAGKLGSGLAAGLCTEGTWRMSFTGVLLGLYSRGGEARFYKACCADSEPAALPS
jgi:alpha-N-arabinofuranosidase